MHPALDPEPLRERLHGDDEPARDEQPGVRVRRRERGERRHGQLQPVGLRLVAAEEQDRAAGRSVRGRREARDVDRVREDLPGARGGTDPLVGGALAELALVEDVLGGVEQRAERPVHVVGLLARPGRVPDPVLVDDERDPSAAQEPEQRAEVARQPVRSQVRDGEVVRPVGEAHSEALDLRRAAGNGSSGRRHPVVAVEDADAGLAAAPTREQEPPPACGAAAVALGPRAGSGPRRHAGSGSSTKPRRSSFQRGRSAGYEFSSAVALAAARTADNSSSAPSAT